MITEAELNLVRQVKDKYAEHPGYQPTPEEWDAIVVAANGTIDWWEQIESARWCLINALNTMTPHGKPSSTLNVQHRYVQQQIRLHEAELAKAQREGCSGFVLDGVFNRCGLGGGAVSADVVWCCLAELEEERIDEQMHQVESLLSCLTHLKNYNHNCPRSTEK